MDDPLLVRGLERFGDLSCDRQCFIKRNRPLCDAIGERRPFDELEHERMRAAGILEAVDARDLWMIQGREHLSFALEPREILSIERERIRKNFERDLAIELCIAGAVDLAHTARADLGDDLIRAETRTGSERHGKW